MKKYTIIFALVLTTLNLFAQKFKVYNESGQAIDLIIWQNSKIIYHDTLKNNQNVEVDFSSQVMVQLKYLGTYCDNTSPESTVKTIMLSNGYIQCVITPSFLNKLFGFGGIEIMPPTCPPLPKA